MIITIRAEAFRKTVFTLDAFPSNTIVFIGLFRLQRVLVKLTLVFGVATCALTIVLPTFSLSVGSAVIFGGIAGGFATIGIMMATTLVFLLFEILGLLRKNTHESTKVLLPKVLIFAPLQNGPNALA